MDLENEYEPNDDYESYAMRQRIQPHGGQLMMTTQVTTKVPPGFDGKTSWLAQRRSIKFASVAHNKVQFTKRHSKTKLTGTQAKVWSHLKKSGPKSLCSRSKSDRRFNPRMEQYVYSYMWRFNNQNWWKQPGELCKQR